MGLFLSLSSDFLSIGHSGDDVKSKNLKRPETYDEWLQKLKDAEGKIKEEKLKLKEGQKLKKMEEEEK